MFLLALVKEIKLQKLSEEDDIEHYFTTFKRITEVCRWLREDWAIRLIPLLTGKALDVMDAREYAHVKEAILAKYSINQKNYRQRFHAMEVLGDKIPKEVYVCLKDMYQKWVRLAGKTKQQIGEMVILEQFYSVS